MAFRKTAAFLALVAAQCARGGDEHNADRDKNPAQRDTIVVTGAYEPLPLSEADRSIRSIRLEDLRTLANTFADVLRLDSSVDLRQRAPNGLQGDVSIRGGTFGQTLVLLDGMRLNDVQSGHHNLDIPVPLESLSAVEILKGSGSTLYGSDAVGGVLNFITRRPETGEVKLWGGIGSSGTNQQRITASVAKDRIAEQFSASRDFSTGFIPNRDYRNLLATSSTWIRTAPGETHLTFSYRDSPFGAEQFYGNFNSWERTKTWWAAVRQNLNRATYVSASFRRHSDLFVLYRDRPQVFTNRHIGETVQIVLRRQDQIHRNITLFSGAEFLSDSITSTNLGGHGRAREAGYVALDMRALGRFSFNAGLRDEIYGSLNHQLSPSISGGVFFSHALKLRASFSRAFRLPTYTDLYYQDPANRGSPNLRPEKADSYEAGLDWAGNRRVSASVTVFHRRETDGIDYVRFSPADIWRATNFQKLSFTGVETNVTFRIRATQVVDLAWTALHGAQNALAGRESKYVFNYPVNSGIVSWYGQPSGIFVARMRFGVSDRYARDAYWVWDAYGARARGRIRPFLQFTNLTGTRFEEIPGVAMPGRAFLAGVELIPLGAH